MDTQQIESRSLDFDPDENSQLCLDKLQIGSPAKGQALSTSRSLPPTPPLSFSPSPQQSSVWKDYPFVDHCRTGSPSQHSYSYAGSNRSPMSTPVLSFSPNSPYNNYRSSPVADIFGGRGGKSKPPLIGPSKLTSPSLSSFTAAANISCGIYYHQSSAAGLWNWMENPISRSSSQSSGFVSQKELEQEQYSRGASPSSSSQRDYFPSANFFQTNYPSSACSNGKYSQASFIPQQVSFLPCIDRRNGFGFGYPPRDNSTPARDGIFSRNKNLSLASSAAETCSRFGPRRFSTRQKSQGGYESDFMFSDTEDESVCESFKTAGKASSQYSLRVRRKEETKNTEEYSSDVKEETPFSSSLMNFFQELLHKIFCSICIFLGIIIMFWIIFGSGISSLFLDFLLDFSILEYFSWVNHVSQNISHCVRDSVSFF